MVGTNIASGIMFPSRGEPSRSHSLALTACAQNPNLLLLLFDGQGLWEEHGVGSLCTLVPILALALLIPSCVTPGSSGNLTEPQFLHL